MSSLSILSGGAAHGLVHALGGDFTSASQFTLDGTYGAVGAMRANLEGGHPTDVVILTSAIVRDLAAKGVVLADSVTDIGSAETAIATRAGDPVPKVGDAEALTLALIAADGIYVPDLTQSTAGLHVAAVLEKLGITHAVASRLRMYPNGQTAMRAMAASKDVRPIGCTQVTEIVSTPGVALIKSLPEGYGLATMYTAGVVAASKNPAAARQLIALLASGGNAAVRRTCGFV
jgi:molybdate transport system substrate-binding protein